MKRILGVIAVVGLVAGLAANTASAQLYNMPVYVSPAFGTGVGVFGNFGMGLNDDAKLLGTGDSPMAFGGHVILGLSKFQIMGGAMYVDPKITGVDKEISFGGNLGLTLYRLPASVLVVNVQAGAGFVKFGDAGDEVKQWNFPIAVGFAANVPVVGAFVEPWIAPRVQIFSSSATGFDSETDIGFGVSGGINANLLLGIGAWAALDWYTVKYGDSSESTSPMTLGAGLSWKFSVPSLGIPGGIIGG